MPAYLAFGLRIESERELSAAVAEDYRRISDRGVQTDVTVSWAALDKPDAGAAGNGELAWYDLRQGLHRFGWPQVGVIEVRDGREIVVRPKTDIIDGLTEQALFGPVMADILLTRGLLPLHASASFVADRAIAIVGRSEAGKSTLAAALELSGHSVFADDLLGVPVKSQTVVDRGLRRSRLDPETTRKLDELFPGPRAAGAAEKTRGKSGDAGPDRSRAPLCAMYRLDEGPVIAIERIDPRQAIFDIYLNLFRVEVEQHVFGAQELLRRCSDVATRVPVFALRRPRDLATLPRVTAAVVAHAQSLPPT